MPGWTPEQLDAIEKRDKQILVAAAAGSGKTSVLVERIIRRVTNPADPVDVDRLLVVTFTNGAAAEMRERIGRAIGAALEQNPGSSHLRRQLALLQRAAISTIHSFCLDIIRQYFYYLDLDPSFRVMDETESALLQLDVLEDVLESRYAAGDHGFLHLVDCYGGSKDDGGIQDLVLEVYKFSRSTPDPVAWLNALPEAFDIPGDVDVDGLPWFRVLVECVRNEIAATRGLVEVAAGLCRRPGGPAPYLDALEKDLELIAGLTAACDNGWDAIGLKFGELSFARLARCRKDEADAGLVEQVKKLRDTVKRKLQGLKNRYFHRPAAELLADLRQLKTAAETLAGLVGEFAASYHKAKLERAVVDFNDLEYYALQILSSGKSVTGAPQPSAVALGIRKRYLEVLVDEYQDINAVQETILNLISGGDGGPGLFMVGDVKQSIYRFRLAEPGLFLAKYELFSTEPGAGRLVNLARNFRSRRGVVDAVNYLFRRVMSRAVGELDYDDRAQLVYGGEYPVPPVENDDLDTVELHLVETSGEEQPGEAPGDYRAGEEEPGEVPGELEEEPDALQLEARVVARRIIQLVESGYPVYDRAENKYRPVTFRDVVVLMRATTGRANTFVEEFQRLGVPVYAELATGYFEAAEVEMILSLLKVIDNPRQDIPLAAVLRSPAAGFNSEDMAQIRLYGGGGEFYDALLKVKKEGPGELSRRVAVFLRRLEGWRTIARQQSLQSLIWTLYRDTGYYDYVGGLPGGSQRQANLRALYHRAGQFEATAYRGLFRFLRFIERLRRGEGDMGTARSLGENENVVRVMSVHKSKGLEFPVVIVAGLGKKFNFTGLNSSVLLHRELGLGPQMVDPEKRITYPTIAKLAVREKLKAEWLAEEMRLLYVAMTRAKEKLILVGSVSGLANRSTRWCGTAGAGDGPLPEWLTSQADNCLDWICPVLAGHPAGVLLRKLAGVDEATGASGKEDSSRWLLTLHYGKDPEPESQPGVPVKYRDAVRELVPVPFAGPRAKEVSSRLEWVYPYSQLRGIPARATVTGLQAGLPGTGDTGLEARENRQPIKAATALKPAFIQQRKGLDAAGRGQALHLVMQLLNLEGDLSADGIRDQLALLVDREQLTPEQAAAVNPEAVAEFYYSPLGRRVLAGRRVFRELPFTLALPVGDIYPGIHRKHPCDREETILVQGIIDCLVEENDGLVVLDYKTDRYTPETLAELVERYRPQVELYAKAAETLTGMPVIARYIYLFYLGDAVEI